MSKKPRRAAKKKTGPTGPTAPDAAYKGAPVRNHGTELIVALDFPRPDRAMELVEMVAEEPVLFKVGLELFTAGGPDFVRELVRQKKRVFLDLKFHDIPNTVARAAQQAALLHVEMFSLHLSGGSAMVRAVAEAMEEISLLRPKIIGVSVLTSFDDVRWAEVTKSLTGHAVDTGESVAGLVEHAVAWGADGVVCSSLELMALRSRFPSLYTVVPGIRPEGISADDQARVMTPAQARAAGANAIVVGRPITQAKNPRDMVRRVLKELSDAAVSA